MKTNELINIIKMHLWSNHMRVIDHATDKAAAGDLVAEYQEAYGNSFFIYHE